MVSERREDNSPSLYTPCGWIISDDDICIEHDSTLAMVGFLHFSTSRFEIHSQRFQHGASAAG